MREPVRQALSLYRPRNAQLVDPWSFVHLGTCMALTFAFGPIVALVVSTLWEPLEIRVLSPVLARRGIDFGHESLANSLADVAFNLAGVAAGAAVMAYTGHDAPWSPWSPF